MRWRRWASIPRRYRPWTWRYLRPLPKTGRLSVRQAEETETIPFFLPGYGGVMARAAALSTIEDLPVDMRRLTDTMLAEHEEHLARDREVRNLTERIQENWRRWPELGWAAQARGCAVEELRQYDAWREEGTALLEAGRTLLEADGHAGRHLHAMPGGRAGLEGAVETLERTRLRDEALLGFEARLQEVNVRARAADTIPFYAQGHGGLLEQARALALLPHLPARHAAAAEGVIADARACESLRTEIEALRGRTARLLDERPALENLAAGEPLVGLGDYAAWWDRCKAAKLDWQGMLDDPGTLRPHLDRFGEEAAAIKTALDRLAKLRGHDLFDDSMKGIEETAQAARGRGILPFHDDACCKAVDEAKRLAGKHELDEEARRRLQAVLEEQAARAAEWMVVVKLLRDMGRLERRSLQLEIDAEQREVPRTELSGWQKLQDEILLFVKDARAALDDGTLQAHWESRPDIRASIEKGLPTSGGEGGAGARTFRAHRRLSHQVQKGHRPRGLAAVDRSRRTEVVEVGGKRPRGPRGGRAIRGRARREDSRKIRTRRPLHRGGLLAFGRRTPRRNEPVVRHADRGRLLARLLGGRGDTQRGGAQAKPGVEGKSGDRVAARAVPEHEALMGSVEPLSIRAGVSTPRGAAARAPCPSPGPRRRGMPCVSLPLPEPEVSLGG